MKKKEILGILAIVLTMIACGIAYYVFWMAVISFAISAVVFPVVFHAVKPKYVWYSILLAVAFDLMLFWQEYSYYEARGLFVMVTILQVVLMAVVILVVKLIGRKLERG